MTDTDTLVQAMFDKASELTARKNKLVDDGRKPTEELRSKIYQCIVGLEDTAVRLRELPQP